VITHANIWLAAIGLAFGLIGLMFLISGNTRRLRLIYEFTASGAELTAVLERMPEERRSRRDFDEDEGYFKYREQERRRWHLYMNQLGDYESALLKLGAYEHALQVSRWIAQNGGRLPDSLER
jgi:hypothetical protein